MCEGGKAPHLNSSAKQEASCQWIVCSVVGQEEHDFSRRSPVQTIAGAREMVADYGFGRHRGVASCNAAQDHRHSRDATVKISRMVNIFLAAAEKPASNKLGTGVGISASWTASSLWTMTLWSKKPGRGKQYRPMGAQCSSQRHSDASFWPSSHGLGFTVLSGSLSSGGECSVVQVLKSGTVRRRTRTYPSVQEKGEQKNKIIPKTLTVSKCHQAHHQPWPEHQHHPQVHKSLISAVHFSPPHHQHHGCLWRWNGGVPGALRSPAGISLSIPKCCKP